MSSKAEQTTKFIVQTVAPIFNRKGYFGTSMADLTKATGLTKGAIYGNFKNKEELATIAFQYNVDRVVNHIKSKLAPIDSSLQKLYGLIAFYRGYQQYVEKYGGCPLVNIGVDANHLNPELLSRVQVVITKLQFYIIKMIEVAKEQGEIKPTVNATEYGRFFFTLIEGAVFMTSTMKTSDYMEETMDRIILIIDRELVL